MTKAILFDLDGTLTDPFEGITRSHQYALEKMGVRSIPTQRELARFIGPPLRSAYAELLGPDATGADVERTVDFYRERYVTVGLFENVVYDGIDRMLGELRAAGRRLFVATSKIRPSAVRILEHFQLAHHFEAVYGTDLDGRLDDKADLLALLLREQHLSPAETIMVGDREHDIRAAKKNTLRALGVLWGYGTPTELTTAGAETLCASPPDVVRALVPPS